ncbi:MAG: hypothetical protein NVS3B20_26790 [Polyangiales bacterium]
MTIRTLNCQGAPGFAKVAARLRTVIVASTLPRPLAVNEAFAMSVKMRNRLKYVVWTWCTDGTVSALER